MANLSDKKCAPCEGGARPLGHAEALVLMRELPGWRLSDDSRSISIEYLMKDFTAAVGCIGDIARIAESEGHHPDLHLTGYRKLGVELSTHAIGQTA